MLIFYDSPPKKNFWHYLDCSNIYNPIANCFESDGNECFEPCCGTSCPGNPVESCGIDPFDPPMYNVYYNFDSQFSCSDFVWPGGAPLTPGGTGWRFSYFYKYVNDWFIFWKGIWYRPSDSVSARAMPRNAVNLPVPLPRGNLTVEACVAACGNAGLFSRLSIHISFQSNTWNLGYTLAGTEYADECCMYFQAQNFTTYWPLNRLWTRTTVKQSTYHRLFAAPRKLPVQIDSHAV